MYHRSKCIFVYQLSILFLLIQSHLQSMTGVSRDLVCIADVHFHPVRTTLSEIFRCLKLCDVFVAVVSKNYCRSRYCQYEIEHAHLLQRPIILIFTEHVPEENMNLITKEVFDTFTRVQLVLENGEYKLQPGWQQLCESVIQLLGLRGLRPGSTQTGLYSHRIWLEA